jgi:small GTP-binding protein
MSEVYISYAWPKTSKRSDPKLTLVNKINKTLTQNKFKVRIDKKDVLYKDKISEFEERLGKGHKIILVVCDKFLRSRHCMYEVLKIHERGNINQRIFPIVCSDAKIHTATDRLEYIEHWEKQKQTLEKRVKRLKSQASINSANNEINILNKFRDIIDSITDTLADMNTLSSDEHIKTNFDQLEKLLKDNKIEFSKSDEQTFGLKVKTTLLLYDSAIEIVSKELKTQENKESEILIRIQDWRQKCLNQTFQIGVMAMVKSGKSSFLNSLMGNEFLPTSNVAETAVPVRIIHAAEPNGKLVVTAEVEVTGAKDIKAYLKELNHTKRDVGVANLIEPKLSSSLVALDDLSMSKIKFEILDTPGFGEVQKSEIVGKSINQGNEDVLDQISVVIYLLDYTKLKTEHEDQVLAKFSARPDIIEKIQDRLFIVVNKMDEEDRHSLNPEQTIDYVYDLVRTKIPKLNKKQVFTISAKKALLSRLILLDNATPEAKQDFGKMAFGRLASTVDDYQYKEYAKTLLGESNINVIESQLIDFIYKERGRLFVETLLDNLKRYLSDFKNKFISTPQGALSVTITEIEALEKKIAEAKKKQKGIEDEADSFETEIKTWIEGEFKEFEKNINSSIGLLFSTDKPQHQSKFLGVKIPLWLESLRSKVQSAFVESISESRIQTLAKITKLNKEIIVQFNKEFSEFKKELEYKVFEKQKGLMQKLETSINVMARDFESTVKKSLHVNLVSIQLHLLHNIDFDRIQAEADSSIDRFVKTQTVEKDVPLEFEIYIEGGFCRKGRFETHTHWQRMAVPEYQISKDSVASFWKSSMETMAGDAKKIAIDFINEQIRKQIKIASDSINNYIGEYLSIIQYEKVRISSGNVNAITERIENLKELEKVVSGLMDSIEELNK